MILTTKAYIKNTHDYGFRCGQWAKIIGVKFVAPDDKTPARACYEVKYVDGVIDYIVIENANHYVLSGFPQS